MTAPTKSGEEQESAALPARLMAKNPHYEMDRDDLDLTMRFATPFLFRSDFFSTSTFPSGVGRTLLDSYYYRRSFRDLQRCFPFL
jgi:hypothetical protein